MTRVASLYLPDWSIDRLRRAERPHAPPEARAGNAFDALGRVAAEERAQHCSVPKEGGWRPGARWARSDVAAAIEALPPHRRPPQRELGRTSIAADNPFKGGAEAHRQSSPLGQPAWAASDAEVEAAIAALPLHQRPPFRELSRRSEVMAHPFKPMPPDEGVPPSMAPLRAPVPPLQFPGEDAPAKTGRRPRYNNEAPSLAALAAMPPVQFPGEDMADRRAMRARRRPTSRDGHNGEASSIAAPSLAQLAMMPAVQFPGEGPHPDKHGRSEPTAPTYGQGRFFQTGRTLGDVVARVIPEDAAGGAAPVADAEPPLVTTHKVGSRVLIAAASPAARAHGLSPGMALTQARAQVPGLEVRPADPQGDRAELERLALTLARRWTPVVAVSDDGSGAGLLLDLTGVCHLHGGEHRLARRLQRLLARHGVTARVAIADTAGAAHALARFGAAIQRRPSGAPTSGGPRPGGNGQGTPGWAADARTAVDCEREGIVIAPPDGHAALLAPLPVAALRLEPAALELLARLGIDRVDQLLDLPRAPLARRFGRALVTRLDQALGGVPEPLDPVVPREPIVVSQRFAEPIATPEAIRHWLEQLMPRLTAALAADGLGARMIELVADRVDGRPQVLAVGLARPTRDAAHLLRLTLRRIEEIEPGYGLDALALHVRRADPLAPETLAPALAEEAAPDLGPLVDTLANRIGAQRLWRACTVDSDVPERSVAGAAPLDPPARAAAPLKSDDVRRLDTRSRDHPWHPRWPRPARLLRQPEPVDHVLAELPDQPPRRFTWRGRTYQVARADGPERIGGEWWRRSAERHAVRDYFLVEDADGQRFWLYRRGDGLRAETGDLAWFVHGAFA